jgi:hypothetical protein
MTSDETDSMWIPSVQEFTPENRREVAFQFLEGGFELASVSSPLNMGQR